jgi:hypothetical protein
MPRLVPSSTGNCVAVYKSFDLNSDKEDGVPE